MLTDYLQIVQNPMDLQTVKEELLGGNYESPNEFAKDVRLIFTNSRNYNTNKRSRVSSFAKCWHFAPSRHGNTYRSWLAEVDLILARMIRVKGDLINMIILIRPCPPPLNLDDCLVAL